MGPKPPESCPEGWAGAGEEKLPQGFFFFIGSRKGNMILCTTTEPEAMVSEGLGKEILSD